MKLIYFVTLSFYYKSKNNIVYEIAKISYMYFKL